MKIHITWPNQEFLVREYHKTVYWLCFYKKPNPESTTINAYFKINSKANDKFQIKIQIYQRNTRAKSKFCEDIHTFLLAGGEKAQLGYNWLQG